MLSVRSPWLSNRRRSRWSSTVGLAGALLAVAALLVAGHAQPAVAAGPIDQQNTAATVQELAAEQHTFQAQTFTVGRTGLLDRVSLALSRDLSRTSSVQVQIRTAAADGLPSATILATVFISGFAISTRNAAFAGADVSPPIAVQAGQRLALIVVGSGVPGLGLAYWAMSEEAYAGGRQACGSTTAMWIFGTCTQGVVAEGDYQFQTFVTPPPPELTLTAAVSPNPTAPAGQPLTWTFVVTNTGQAPLSSATFSATLSAGLRANLPTITPAAAQPCTLTNAGQRTACPLGALASGQSVTVTITAMVLSVAVGTNLCATGQVNAGTTGATVTRQAQACTRVGPPPPPPADLTSSVDCRATPTHDGRHMVTCTATVTNVGGTAATIPDQTDLIVLVLTAVGLSVSQCGLTGDIPPGYALVPSCLPLRVVLRAQGNQTVAAGQSLSVSANLYLNAGTGSVHVTATADPGSRVTEANEGNNDATPVDVPVPPP
jgi:uncharacterized repeat protein (TIGR01451 family)